jgi:hypothetical protein
MYIFLVYFIVLIATDMFCKEIKTDNTLKEINNQNTYYYYLIYIHSIAQVFLICQVPLIKIFCYRENQWKWDPLLYVIVPYKISFGFEIVDNFRCHQVEDILSHGECYLWVLMHECWAIFLGFKGRK